MREMALRLGPLRAQDSYLTRTWLGTYFLDQIVTMSVCNLILFSLWPDLGTEVVRSQLRAAAMLGITWWFGLRGSWHIHRFIDYAMKLDYNTSFEKLRRNWCRGSTTSLWPKPTLPDRFTILAAWCLPLLEAMQVLALCAKLVQGDFGGEATGAEDDSAAVRYISHALGLSLGRLPNVTWETQYFLVLAMVVLGSMLPLACVMLASCYFAQPWAISSATTFKRGVTFVEVERLYFAHPLVRMLIFIHILWFLPFLEWLEKRRPKPHKEYLVTITTLLVSAAPLLAIPVFGFLSEALSCDTGGFSFVEGLVCTRSQIFYGLPAWFIVTPYFLVAMTLGTMGSFAMAFDVHKAEMEARPGFVMGPMLLREPTFYRRLLASKVFSVAATALFGRTFPVVAGWCLVLVSVTLTYHFTPFGLAAHVAHHGTDAGRIYPTNLDSLNFWSGVLSAYTSFFLFLGALAISLGSHLRLGTVYLVGGLGFVLVMTVAFAWRKGWLLRCGGPSKASQEARLKLMERDIRHRKQTRIAARHRSSLADDADDPADPAKASDRR
jgi:hypothetical protein